MGDRKITLKDGIKFHGHLGPYLVLGILAGELAIKRLRCKKYFGLDVNVRGASQKPKSCLIDGLQLSTGSTYGKGNIKKFKGHTIKIDFCNLGNHKKITFTLKDGLIRILQRAKTHKDSELLARRLYNTDPLELFSLTTTC
jgi:formylmethanofuran dehydrogenase subunit E